MERNCLTAEEIQIVWAAHKTVAAIDAELAEYKEHCDLVCGKFSAWCNSRCGIPQMVAVLKIKRREILGCTT